MKSRGIAIELLASALVVIASTTLLRDPDAVDAPWNGGAYRRLGIATVGGRPDLSDVSITLKRAGIPDYEVTLYGVGVAVYEGKRFVTTMGRWEFDLPVTTLLPILDQLQRLDFMNVDDRCRWISMHSARHTLTLRVGTHEHSFVDLSGGEWGSDDEEHAALHRSMANAMNSIDKVSGIEQWIGSEADREALYEEDRRQQGQAYKRRIQMQGK